MEIEEYRVQFEAFKRQAIDKVKVLLAQIKDLQRQIASYQAASRLPQAAPFTIKTSSSITATATISSSTSGNMIINNSSCTKNNSAPTAALKRRKIAS